jgi:hypothetical protein
LGAETLESETALGKPPLHFGIPAVFSSRLLAGEDSFTVGLAFVHGADRLLRSIHRQDLTNFGLDAGANYELNQIIHFLPCAHDGAAHGNLLDEKPHKIGTRVVAGGNSHGDDHSASAY